MSFSDPFTIDVGSGNEGKPVTAFVLDASGDPTGSNLVDSFYYTTGQPRLCSGVNVLADSFVGVLAWFVDDTTEVARASFDFRGDGAIGYIAGMVNNISAAVVSVGSQIDAINQSASRRIMVQTTAQYERPESGSSSYTIEARTYDADGADVNADSTPSLTATGIVSGTLAANLSIASNPSTGVYRWTYSVASNALIEQVRFTVSASIDSSTFSISCYTQVCDFVAATWTTTDRATLTGISTKIGTPAGASLSADIAAVKTDTGSLVTRIPAALFAGITSLGKWFQAFARSDTPDSTAIGEINAGGGDFSPPDQSLEAIAASAAGGSPAPGAFTMTVTVTNSETDLPIEDARITWSQAGVAVQSGQTNASGVSELGVNAGTYVRTVTASGYGSSTATIVVTAGTSASVELTSTVITPSANPALSMGYCTTYNGHGETQEDVTLSFAMKDPNPNDEDGDGAGTSWTRRVFTATSDSDGVVQTTFKRGGSYRAKRANGAWIDFTVPDADSFALPEILSEEQTA